MAANTVTITTLFDGTKRRVVHVDVKGVDGTQESGTVIYDYSADTLAGPDKTKYTIQQLWASIDGTASADIDFDGATPWTAMGLTQYGPARNLDFRGFGGIPNKATTPTGDVTLTTVNLGANDHVHFILDLAKV